MFWWFCWAWPAEGVAGVPAAESSGGELGGLVAVVEAGVGCPVKEGTR